jgi:4-carboxymuconolactone decarboxylase
MDVVELAILVTARELNQQVEWAAHEPTGRRAGLSEATIDTVKFRRATVGLGDRDATLSGRNDG